MVVLIGLATYKADGIKENTMGIRTKFNPMGGRIKNGSSPSGDKDYGPFCFRIDTSNSNPTTAVTYMGNNADYTPATMNFSTGTLDYGSWENAFFQPRPVMLKYDGTVDYELDHNDFTKKLDGSASDVSNTSYGGNCMIAFPQVWLKFETSGNYQYVYVASEKLDNNYRCYSHYNNNGVLLDEIYVMAYEPSNISNKLRSLAGQTILYNLSGVTMRTYAQANGNGWDFLDLGTLQLIQMLFILMFKSRNSQATAGAGVVNSSKSHTAYPTTGDTKDKGMFYSLCNDPNSANATTPIKTFGIENLWGSRYKWINGLKSYQTTIYYKLCNYTTDGTTQAGYTPTTSDGGYKSYTRSSNTTTYNLEMPNTSDGLMWYWTGATGSNPTYYCDQMYFSPSTSSSNVGCARFGGRYNDGARAGFFCVNLSCNNPLSDSGSSYGASLSCKPL